MEKIKKLELTKKISKDRNWLIEFTEKEWGWEWKKK